jgi:hypothetical protein
LPFFKFHDHGHPVVDGLHHISSATEIRIEHDPVTCLAGT